MFYLPMLALLSFMPIKLLYQQFMQILLMLKTLLLLRLLLL